ncbi:MAG: nickel pincer cofactor biosynthesis protein LarB [Myxococcota bacterium]
MSPERIERLLRAVAAGTTDVPTALDALRKLPFEDIGVATVDHHRALRQGTPEVIFGAGKTAEQMVAITTALAAEGHNVLITRIASSAAEDVKRAHPRARHNAIAQTLWLEDHAVPGRPCAPVALVCAGTSDIPVAEETLETLAAVGIGTKKIYDVGVAGLHRLLHRAEEMAEASAVVVFAGMEAALPSVVGGLVGRPVIAVPTSVGYGTHFGGVTALLGMLNACASGLLVVNVDNGFGAAMALHRMLPRATPAEGEPPA